VDVGFGLAAHSGWAALVAVGRSAEALALVERRRLELVRPEDGEWAKQPYHAAHGLDRDDAQDVVRRGIASARERAAHALAMAADSCRARGHEVRTCAVLVGDGMPAWSVDEILAVHFRMHKAEGELFRDALLTGASACGLVALGLRAKSLADDAPRALGLGAATIDAALAALGQSAGPPWGKDQKSAALAAWVGLAERAA